MTQENTQKLGIVVSGSLNKGIEVKLDSSASPFVSLNSYIASHRHILN